MTFAAGANFNRNRAFFHDVYGFSDVLFYFGFIYARIAHATHKNCFQKIISKINGMVQDRNREA